MSELTIEAGKYYKTKSAARVKISEIVGDYGIGFAMSSMPPRVYVWKINGKCENINLNLLDIVAPWPDPPVVDWSKFPPHIVALAMDSYEGWYGFTEIPDRIECTNGNIGTWSVGKPYHAFNIRDDERPVFSGDWRGSLAIRPGYEAQK